jgi:hypothetical protein
MAANAITAQIVVKRKRETPALHDSPPLPANIWADSTTAPDGFGISVPATLADREYNNRRLAEACTGLAATQL